MRHHIAIYYDKHARKLYATPGTTFARRGDTLTIHAINTEIVLKTRYSRVLGAKSGRKIKEGDSFRRKIPRTPWIAPPGLYEFDAYSKAHRLHAIGGSYPKVIIYD